MGILYSVVIAAILLFPWLVVACMVIGTLRERWSRLHLGGNSTPPTSAPTRQS